MGLRSLVRADSVAPIGGGDRLLRRDTGGHLYNPEMGLGTPLDRDAWTTVRAPEPLTSYEIDTLLRHNAMARRIVSREPNDATRAGYELVKADDEVLAERLRMAADGRKKSLKFLRAIRRARTWAKAYGGSAIVVDLDDGLPPRAPVDLTRIRKIRKLLVLDRWEIHPEAWSTDPRSKYYGEPVLYRIQQGRNARSILVHASRVIRFDGVDLPERVKLAWGSDGWGSPELELVWETLRDYGVTNHVSVSFLPLMNQGVLKSAGLARTAEAQDPQSIVRRLEAMRIAAGVFGEMAIDKDEDYQILARPISGIGEIGEISVRALVSDTGIPRTILLGETPGGINAGEQAAEVLAWYDAVAVEQPDIYQPPLERLLLFLMASEEGPTGGRILEFEVEWLPLWQESKQEQGARWLTNAQRRSLDVQSGVISADEARQDSDLVEIYEIDPTEPAPPAPGGMLPPDDDTYAEVQPEDGEALDPLPPAETVIPPGAQLVSLRAAAEQCGFTAGAIRGMIRRGEIKRWKAGNMVRVNLPDVLSQISVS